MMEGIKVRVVAGRGKPIPAGWHDPGLLDEINEKWQRAGRGITLEVRLPYPDPTETSWIVVGTELCMQLLSAGRWYGLYVDMPDLLFDWVFRWVRLATAGGALALADLTLVSRPHATGFAWNTEEVRCCLFQATHLGSWIGAVWNDAEGGFFFYPHFVLAVYEENITADLDRFTPLTEDLFIGLLERAVAWLIPYGDPPLFIVGLPPSSELYRELAASIQQ